jgi:hypothetical protein
VRGRELRALVRFGENQGAATRIRARMARDIYGYTRVTWLESADHGSCRREVCGPRFLAKEADANCRWKYCQPCCRVDGNEP